MGIAVKVISAILKSVASNKIGNEFGNEIAGIFIDEVTGKGIDKIKDFINEGKVKIERILSKENMESMNIPEDNIDYVVAEIKDLFSRIDITDEVFRQCKYKSGNLSDFLWNEYSEKTDFIEYEGNIKKCLVMIAEAVISLVRESENFEGNLLIQASNTIDDFREEVRKEFDTVKENQKKYMQRTMEEDIVNRDKKFQNNKKQNYIKNWNSRLFLHVDNDENPITLREAFIMPDYKVPKGIKRMGFSSDDTLDKIIEKFVKYNKTSTMLIHGVPGIGKSTITSWLANKYNNDDEYIILRFRDWDEEELEEGLLKAVCSTLKCQKKELEYKILILDGFDEMKTLDIRENILNSFFNDIKDFDNIKCIITSRPGYISFHDFRNVLELQNFDIDKVEEFCKKITGKGLDDKENIKSNLEVLGIPVILYMAIMSNINISENPTKPELYNRIFAERGGIFDRFFDGNVEYASGKQILRDPINIKKYLNFLRETAFKMLEKNSLSLQRKDCAIPKLEFEKKEISVLEFPIKHLFEYADKNIEFIHKSIYEYFVSDYIFVLIYEAINTGISKEYFAGVLGRNLKKYRLSPEILEFLKFKICHCELIDKFDIIYEIFQLMIQDGMTYYASKIFKDYYKNVIDCEMNIFANMLEIVHLWNFDVPKFDKGIMIYLKYNIGSNLNIAKINMYRENLPEVNLKRANLQGSDLRKADLEASNLSGANLQGSDLREADLETSNLSEANLQEAILDGVSLYDAKLAGAYLYGASLYGAGLESANLEETYLRKTDLREINLKGANLSKANLRDADLREADLREADLSKANLSKADLSRADLSKADLSKADLREANLKGADLRKVNLYSTIIDESNVKYLKNKYNLKSTKVYIISTRKIISYEEYCNRKHWD